MEWLLSSFRVFDELLEEQFKDVNRWKIILGSFAITSSYLWIRRFIAETEDVIEFCKESIFTSVKKLPPVKKKIAQELEIARIGIEEELITPEEKILEKYHKLPEKGLSSDKVREITTKALTLGKFEWKEGKVSGGMFAGADQEYNEFLTQVYGMQIWTNPLHADLFPGIAKMEAEIVRMTIELFHGDENVVGTMSSGGTESLFLMMKTYRDWGRSRGIKRPEVIAPNTIHGAIAKSHQILKFNRVIRLPLDHKTMTVRISDVKKSINSNTVLIVLSAPEYSYGTIDDIESIAALAKSYGIPLHVDCCLGGFILPFMEKAGYSPPPFDFRVPGVTSISADTHKYGRTPKGSSVIMYKNKDLAHHQYFYQPDWPGGIYASPTFAGSRSGSYIAMTWAAMLHHGVEGYVGLTKKIIGIARYLKKEFSQIPGIFVYGDPLASVVAIGSNEFNIYDLADAMNNKGWHLQPLQYPTGVHIFLTELHTKEGLAEELVREIRKSVEEIQKGSSSPNQGLAKLYGMAHSMPDKGIIREASAVYNDVYYSTSE